MAEGARRYDAVVVGGGHNGLVAAAYLGLAGQSVLLLERNQKVGGATASDAIFPGMDARLSRYSYLVSLFPQSILQDLGVRFTCRRRRIASCTPYEDEGAPRALLLSNDASASLASVSDMAGEEDRRGYEHLLAMEHALAARVWPSLLEPLRSRREWADDLRSPDEREAWEAFVERPLGETLERLVGNDLLRGVIFTDAKIGVFTHSHDPTLLQNRCFLLHVIGQGTGEWQVPMGGMGALVDSLVEVCRRSGVQILCGAAAEAIHPGHPRHVVAYQENGQTREAEATRVLVNAGPQVFARLLGATYRPGADDEGSVSKVNLLLRRLPRLKADVAPEDAFTGTFRIDESYTRMQASYRQASAGALPDKVPAEIYCHTLTDGSILGPGLRRQGYHTLTLFGLDLPYGLFRTDNEEKKAELLNRYFNGLNRVLAEPIQDCLAIDANGRPCVEIKSPTDLEREIALNLGNIFHQAPSWFFSEDGTDTGRWGVETAHERIYLAGSSALRGGAVSGIPGHNAARAIFEELRISLPQRASRL